MMNDGVYRTSVQYRVKRKMSRHCDASFQLALQGLVW